MNALVDICVDLGLALLAQLSPRFARGGVSGLFRRLELAHDLGNRWKLPRLD